MPHPSVWSSRPTVHRWRRLRIDIQRGATDKTSLTSSIPYITFLFAVFLSVLMVTFTHFGIPKFVVRISFSRNASPLCNTHLYIPGGTSHFGDFPAYLKLTHLTIWYNKFLGPSPLFSLLTSEKLTCIELCLHDSFPRQHQTAFVCCP